MIVISSRKSFTDTIAFNKNYIIKEVDESNNDISMGWNIGDVKTAVHDSTVCILIHGYHNNLDEAVESYHVIEANLVKNSFPYKRILGFLWPGSFFALDFKIAEWRANTAGKKLADIVEQLAEANITIDIQTHSLGARVALQAALKTNKIRNIILSAPAVKTRSVLPGGEFFDVETKLFNCFSEGDPVLKKAFRIADWSYALGYCGISGAPYLKSNYAQKDFSSIVHTHGGYRFEPSYYEAWKKFLT